ncbi:hypothetical protein [Streptomyces acidicola]|uniref:Uncharacterized protein n=1 Tax=Streptomyces acidicola TaxID=2596892 RepID=A0A5N8WNH3_9ACTN|nr:hypothetical protein [Streptomyces acidicola]MPY48787.1 hypothetical protein [Streptomyces acidicola]
MPSEEALPPGAQRQFLEELHVHYRQAGRPAVRTIEEVSGQTVSRETARRLLVGRALGRWKVVEALFVALCRISKTDPDVPKWEGGYEDGPTYRDHLRNLWNTAIDAPAPTPLAEQLRAQEDAAKQKVLQGEDPWAQTPADPWATSRRGSGWGGNSASLQDEPPPF